MIRHSTLLALLVLALCGTATAQTTRGFVAVNGGLQSGSTGFSQDRLVESPLFGPEDGTLTARHPGGNATSATACGTLVCSLAQVLNDVWKPCGTASMPAVRGAFVRVMLDSSPPRTDGNTRSEPSRSGRIRSSADRAASDRGTRCSMPDFMRFAGVSIDPADIDFSTSSEAGSLTEDRGVTGSGLFASLYGVGVTTRSTPASRPVTPRLETSRSSPACRPATR